MNATLSRITVTPTADDVPAFASIVESLANGIVEQYKPRALILIKINNWFSRRWLRFSGKSLGLVGIAMYTLSVPPFVPNRVVSQRKFDYPNYSEADPGKPLHIDVEGAQAILRRIAVEAHGAAVMWYSGRSGESGRGSVMSYVPVNGEYMPWYAGWMERASWQLVEAIEIGAPELDQLLAAGGMLSSH
jgi:hypothetical protein